MFDFLLINPQLTVFLRVLIEESGIPLLISSGTMLLFLGCRGQLMWLDFLILALLVSLATFIGSSLLFWLSRHFGHYIINHYQNLLKHLRITPRTINQLELAMNKYGIWFLVLSRFTPGARILGTISAGILGMTYSKFI